MSNSISHEDRWLAQLERYKKYCEDKDSLSYKEKDILKDWIYQQKRYHELGNLREDRTEKLNAIGFFKNETSARQLAWGNNVAKAKAFIDKYGHYQFKDVNTPDAIKLSNWLSYIIVKHRAGKLTEECIEELDGIGIDLDSPSKRDIKWDNSFKEFRAYLDANPFDNELLNASKRLQRWYKTQRIAHKKQKLKRERLEQFNINDIPLILKQARFKNRLNQLAAYHSENNNFLISCGDNKKWPGLHDWIGKITDDFNRNKLAEEQIFKLNTIGFEWNSPNNLEQWELIFEKLKAFLDKKKNIFSDKGTELRNWISSQKIHYKNGKLLPSQVEKLKSLGFQFEVDIASNTYEQRINEKI